MPRIVDSILMECEQEAATRKRVLERVPGDKLDWKPHTKSMSLGQLALHVANTPGDVSGLAALDEVEVPDFGEAPTVSSSEELMDAFDKSLSVALEMLDGLDDEKAMATWKAPRVARS
jgi:hypothetical protein